MAGRGVSTVGGPATLVDSNDASFAKLKKVVIQCEPFRDSTSTIVCTSCFAFLAFPAGSPRVQCGGCNGVMSHISAKCTGNGCGHTLTIPLASREVQCPKCKYTFRPVAKMRVQVPEVLANKIPPPITINVVLSDSVGFCEKVEFAARILVTKSLSMSLPAWEQASGARFNKVQVRGKSETGPILNTSLTPVELGLENGSTVYISCPVAKEGGVTSGGSSCHQFESATFGSPTNCAICHEFIYGVYSQGKKCVRCGLPTHHRCAEDISTMCDAARRQMFGVVDFGDSDDDSGDCKAEAATTAVIAIPIDDPVAFMATLVEDTPPVCDPKAMSKLSQLATFTDEDISAKWLIYDKDSSGYLDEKEALCFLRDLVQSFGEDKPSDETLEALFQKLDSSGDRKIQWEEFVNFFYAQQDVAFLQQFSKGKKTDLLNDTDALYAIWNKYDHDGSGQLETGELIQLLAEVTGLDSTALNKPASKKRHAFSSYVKDGKPMDWDTFCTSLVPVIQNAMRNASK